MLTTIHFETVVYATWFLAMGFFLLVIWLRPRWWQRPAPVQLVEPRREALIGLAAVVALIAISVTADFAFRQWKQNPALRTSVNLGEYLLVYSPVFAVMLWRKQGLSTCFLRFEKLPTKIALGFVLGLLASCLFLALSHKAHYAAFFMTLGRGGPVAMIQTFMEGVLVGFLLYRFGAWLGIGPSAVLVAFLFMAAHIPNYMTTYSLPFATALTMAAAHATITVLILAGMWSSQDVVVIGFLHWFVNAAAAFVAFG